MAKLIRLLVFIGFTTTAGAVSRKLRTSPDTGLDSALNILKRNAAYNGTKPDYDLPQIKKIQARYEKSRMMVSAEFDLPFNGIIFSQGHSTDSHCIHLAPGSGLVSAALDINVDTCGMTSSDNSNRGYVSARSGTFIENTIIIQYDPLVQKNWDQSVTFKVDMLPFVPANYYEDSVVRCWMQIEVGKGPLASQMSGMVGSGQSMTIVL